MCSSDLVYHWKSNIWEWQPTFEIGAGVALNNTFGYPMVFPALYFKFQGGIGDKFSVEMGTMDGAKLAFGYNFSEHFILGYGATALSVWAIGQAIGGHGVLMAVVFVAGLVMNAAQASMPALAAGFYPTEGRATGVAWMLGIGRFGGIAGSFLVADLTARQMSLPDIFGVVAIAALIAMVALGILRLACRGR